MMVFWVLEFNVCMSWSEIVEVDFVVVGFYFWSLGPVFLMIFLIETPHYDTRGSQWRISHRSKHVVVNQSQSVLISTGKVNLRSHPEPHGSPVSPRPVPRAAHEEFFDYIYCSCWQM